jgi:hypothetical protein
MESEKKGKIANDFHEHDKYFSLALHSFSSSLLLNCLLIKIAKQKSKGRRRNEEDDKTH